MLLAKIPGDVLVDVGEDASCAPLSLVFAVLEHMFTYLLGAVRDGALGLILHLGGALGLILHLGGALELILPCSKVRKDGLVCQFSKETWMGC